MRTSMVVPAALVAGMLALTGCTGGDETPEPSGTDSTASADRGGPVQQGGTVFAGTFPAPGDPDTSVRVEVEPLVVTGKTMELRVWFTPDDDTLGDETVNLYEMTGNGDLHPALNDLEHLTQYFVLSSTGLDWETDVVGAKTTNGEPLLYQAWFAAPNEQVDSLDLSLVASWAPFENVPVTYEG